ncbi:MAG: hypothetical protein IT379_15105, partial [Deltaproteobacteria bacterium]|nr:hypothetical protein [Deltaproteobacteria bacterium]
MISRAPRPLATPGGAQSCDDVDECATNNGGCGDPQSVLCINFVGTTPACVPISDCWRGLTTCYDGNACTDDLCDIVVGCTYPAHAGSCDDGDACTLTDTCVGTTCVGANPVVCSALDNCHNPGVC